MKLIDADALIDFIDVGHLRSPSELCYSELDIMNMLLHAPAVDAVDDVLIIRCRDCIHRHSSEYCECRPDDAFCSDGEIK